MFLPKSKYKGPFTASDGDKKVLVLETKEVYKGQYFITYKDQLFEGRFPKEAGRELIFAKVLEEQEKTKRESNIPSASSPVPTEKDYENKFFNRYFAKDKRSGKIIEVDLKEYKKLSKMNSFTGTELKWWIEGPVEDTFFNGYLYVGAINRNKKTVEQAEKDMRGLKSFLFDLKEFVI